MGDKYIKIRDSKQRGFNLSWCRNCGAKISSGDVLVFMDCDLVIPPDYFEKVMGSDIVFASGSNEYVMSTKENTELYYSRKSFDVFRLDTFRLSGYNKRKNMAYGLILIFHRDFWFKVGGFYEGFFRYGNEDNEMSYRVMRLLDKEEDEITRIKSPVYHLFHQGRDFSNISINKIIRQKLQSWDVNDLCDMLKVCGNPEKPYVMDCINGKDIS